MDVFIDVLFVLFGLFVLTGKLPPVTAYPQSEVHGWILVP